MYFRAFPDSSMQAEGWLSTVIAGVLIIFSPLYLLPIHYPTMSLQLSNKLCILNPPLRICFLDEPFSVSVKVIVNALHQQTVRDVQMIKVMLNWRTCTSILFLKTSLACP